MIKLKSQYNLVVLKLIYNNSVYSFNINSDIIYNSGIFKRQKSIAFYLQNLYTLLLSECGSVQHITSNQLNKYNVISAACRRQHNIR